MATFTLTIEAYQNQAPDRVGNLTLNLLHNATHIFTVANFTTETSPTYRDPEGDPLSLVKIISLPTTGQLLLNGVPVLLNDEISVADINSNLFIYQADDLTNTSYVDTFQFQVADSGSGLFYLTNGTVTLNVAQAVNQPPTEVGDGSETINYGQTLVFTRAMFTTNTTPPYSDPEGDAALQLKITALPILGKIKLNGVDVVVNQIINFTQIDSGNLTYVPDLADTDGDLQSFEFQIADAGSGIFVS